mgnify:CR=1 FL=1
MMQDNGKYIKNIFDEGELDWAATVRKFRTVRIEVNHRVKYLWGYFAKVFTILNFTLRGSR